MKSAARIEDFPKGVKEKPMKKMNNTRNETKKTFFLESISLFLLFFIPLESDRDQAISICKSILNAIMYNDRHLCF